MKNIEVRRIETERERGREGEERNSYEYMWRGRKHESSERRQRIKIILGRDDFKGLLLLLVQVFERYDGENMKDVEEEVRKRKEGGKEGMKKVPRVN